MDSELFKTLIERNNDYQDIGHDINKIIARLTKVKANFKNELVKDYTIHFGTTNFFMPTDYNTYGYSVNEEPTADGRYFHGNDE